MKKTQLNRHGKSTQNQLPSYDHSYLCNRRIIHLTAGLCWAELSKQQLWPRELIFKRPLKTILIIWKRICRWYCGPWLRNKQIITDQNNLQMPIRLKKAQLGFKLAVKLTFPFPRHIISKTSFIRSKTAECSESDGTLRWKLKQQRREECITVKKGFIKLGLC